MTTKAISTPNNFDSNYGISFMRGMLLAAPISAAFWGVLALAGHLTGIF